MGIDLPEYEKAQRKKISREAIRQVENRLGLEGEERTSDRVHRQYWEEERKFFPEEADNPAARQRALKFLSSLTSLTDPQTGELLEVCDPKYIQDGYEAYMHAVEVNKHLLEGQRPVRFTLKNVLGAAKRQVAWFQELKGQQETQQYDRDILVLKQVSGVINKMITPPHFKLYF